MLLFFCSFHSLLPIPHGKGHCFEAWSERNATGTYLEGYERGVVYTNICGMRLPLWVT